MDKTPRKPDRKFIQYPEIHPLLRTPDSKLICLPSATKNAWLRMLRSGDYTQGRSALRRIVRINEQDTEAFCCMGVYADLKGPRQWKKPNYLESNYSWNDARGSFPIAHFGSQSKVFMQQTLSYHGPIAKESVFRVLQYANDGIYHGSIYYEPATFEQIALWIERYL